MFSESKFYTRALFPTAPSFKLGEYVYPLEYKLFQNLHTLQIVAYCYLHNMVRPVCIVWASDFSGFRKKEPETTIVMAEKNSNFFI
jgi:hypothetical protein